MLQCIQNPARLKAILAFKTAIRKRDGTNFLKVFGDIVEQWLTCPDQTPCLSNRLNPFLRYEHFPEEYIHLINSALEEQQTIGWNNMCRGFLSKQWYQLASSHICADDASKIINRKDGANRVHRALKITYGLMTALWLGRNDALHGHKQDEDRRRLSALDIEITKYHSEADLVLTDDKFYCETSLERLLQSSSANKRRWLIRVKASRFRKAALQNQQPRITRFFPPRQQDHRKSIPKSPPKESNPLLRTQTTQQRLTHLLIERDSNQSVSARNITTQQLLTQYLKERAPNQQHLEKVLSSPPPSIPDIG
jgi:hypothetical protein